MTSSPRLSLRLVLALSGWVALLAAQFGPDGPLRVALTAAFLLSCPGTAAMLLARPVPTRATSFPDRLAAGVLALALSVTISALVAEAFFLSHEFTVGRVLVTLAALTTVLALVPRGHRIRIRPAEGPRERVRTAARGLRRSHSRRVGLLGAVGLLAFSTACGTASGGDDPTARPSLAPLTSPSRDGSPSGSSPGGHSPAATGPWHLVFQDDFSGTALDRDKWATCYDWNQHGCTNPGNPEKEWYLPGQVEVSGGALSLTAERKTVKGSDGETYPWVSGMVSTGRDTADDRPHRTFTYGYLAASIRIPTDDKGMFPAFWLAVLDSRVDPQELDVAEFINTNEYVDMNLHYGANYQSDGSVHHQVGPADFAADYHVFAMDWQPESITWYVDGVPHFRVTDPALIPDTEMQLILNLAVGYQQLPPDHVNSARLQVDWVEVWQH
ncbi:MULTISPECIES: glycoside hydrolase family 16 protein [unclassified Kitasatospora]|uniref:glycoside hydrolase family 16 protein n=1 Tax=unclassified Kitasatospora TaxID=2633591 RepID=UPI00070DE965|nr:MULTISPECIES: glycoside hydrolase family 16 protein [unclassified Kitasatospora]KQV12123.1 hypothetical protein ASC99_34715 [Kitasatospora sp. Root107]KRB69285.1 hypothetical protein ASE03_28035 [Kitasatospora sp. Root187]